MKEKKIILHHIGGRGGGSILPLHSSDFFNGDLVQVMYDADADCIDEMQYNLDSHTIESKTLPYCLSDNCNLTNFNLNNDPNTSSCLEFNEDYKDSFAFPHNHFFDYTIGDACKLNKKLSIDCVTMDYIFENLNTDLPRPDFLSLDTQGTEYQILQGAKETLNQVVGVISEVEFHKFYKDQKLFGDVCHLLESKGFNFIKFIPHPLVNLFPAALETRGEGVTFASEALFFKKPELIDDDIMLRKLAFIAIAFNQFGYANECLNRSKNVGGANYLNFLNGLSDIINNTKMTFPPSLKSLHKLQNANNNYSVEDDIRSKTISTRLLLLSQKTKNRMIGSILQFLSRVSSSLKWRLFMKKNDIEKYLIEHGFKLQAKTLLKYREYWRY
jgi:FkbM family methyltransferase